MATKLSNKNLHRAGGAGAGGGGGGGGWWQLVIKKDTGAVPERRNYSSLRHRFFVWGSGTSFHFTPAPARGMMGDK